MSELKAVLFDMDGLMIESEHLQSKAFDQILRSHGIEPEYNKAGVIQVVGVTAKENLIRLREKHNIPVSAEELLETKNEIYTEILDEGIEPMPGLHALINSLKSKGIKIAVASSSYMTDIEKVLKMIDLENEFDAIVSGAELKNSKPAPDIFLKAAKQLNVQSKNCAVLEDAEAGIRAGKAAGMTVVAIPSQYTLDNDFSLADHIFDSLEDLNYQRLKELVNQN